MFIEQGAWFRVTGHTGVLYNGPMKRLLMTISDKAACPLCSSGDAQEYGRDNRRRYLRCPVCGLVFVPSSQFLSEEDEKKRYDLHRNASEDQGYRVFLSRLFTPLQERLAPGSSGLDFGSGPEPLLSRMFEDAGHHMTIYDCFYAPDRMALEQRYDFITASEVAEHLRDPLGELDLLWTCLRPGGWLGIMTQPVAGPDAFLQWHYKNDLTHIRFFSDATFAWLAGRWDADLALPEHDVALFHKRTGAPR